MRKLLKLFHQFGKANCILFGIIMISGFILMLFMTIVFASAGDWLTFYSLFTTIAFLFCGILFLCASSDEYR